MLGRILWGLALAVIGAACCYYSYDLVEAFWRNDWMERNIGGTRNWVVLFWFMMIVIWILMIFGVFSVSSPASQIQQTGFAS